MWLEQKHNQYCYMYIDTSIFWFFKWKLFGIEYNFKETNYLKVIIIGIYKRIDDKKFVSGFNLRASFLRRHLTRKLWSISNSIFLNEKISIISVKNHSIFILFSLWIFYVPIFSFFYINIWDTLEKPTLEIARNHCARLHARA